MFKMTRAWAIRLGLFAAVVAVPLGVLVLSNVQDRVRPRGTEAPLRLSGAQFLLNWQSFPARTAIIEYCTIRIEAGRQVSCLVYEGARRLGEIGIDQATFDPASRSWAEKTCGEGNTGLTCSIRLAGTIMRVSGARPVLDKAQILF